MATLIYAYAKELKIIKFPKLEVKQLIEIESDADDMLLAEAGLRDYVALLKKEEAHG